MHSRSGQALVEYVLIVALIAVTAAAALILFRQAVSDALHPAATALECAPPGQGGGNPGYGGAPPPGECRRAQ